MLSLSMIDQRTLEKFKLNFLYPWQTFVINSILHPGHSPGRRIVILPTGSGKTLCFQIPALLEPGLTVVFYPLVALIDDQSRRLQSIGIPHRVLRGGQTLLQRKKIFQECVSGGIKLLLTNPETFFLPEVFSVLKEIPVGHFVVDEAHCFLLWGQTFRSSYLKLSELKFVFPKSQISAFTATMGANLVSSVARALFGEQEPEIINFVPDRKNIFYSTKNFVNLSETLLPILQENSGPTVVFCRNRDTTRKISLLIRHRLGRSDCYFYHAGLEKQERKSVENWFFTSDSGILCSTNAYGMGIDKPNIRTVVHLGPPPTVEDYLQESGRAGRDGAPSKAVLLVRTQKDPILWQDYFQTKECMRNFLLSKLGYEKTECSGCQTCQPPDETKKNAPAIELKKISSVLGHWSMHEMANFLSRPVHLQKFFLWKFPILERIQQWEKEEIRDFFLENTVKELCFRGNSPFMKILKHTTKKITGWFSALLFELNIKSRS